MIHTHQVARPSYIDQSHWHEWVNGSGVAPHIVELGVKSEADPYEIDRLLNRNNKRRWQHWEHGSGWRVAGVDPRTGERIYSGVQFKPDKAVQRLDENGKPKFRSDGSPDVQKYFSASGYESMPLFLDTGDPDYWLDVLTDVSKPIIETEGAKKAGAGLSIGYATISVPGVWNGQKQGRLNPLLKEFYSVGRIIYLAYDSDAMINPAVAKALDRKGRLISAEGAVVKVILLPEDTKGMDDFIVKYGEEEFKKLVDNAATFEEWRKSLGKQFQKTISGSVSSAYMAEEFDSGAEFVQKARKNLFGDKAWICVDNALYYWTGKYYKASLDVVEIQRIWQYCNNYAVANDKGEVRFPYASPSCARQVLDWVKQSCGVDPGLVNPPGINCTNGVLQISWNRKNPQWQLVSHDSAFYYTYEPISTYNPDADPSSCDRLLEVLDAPQQEIFLRTIAASLDLATVRQHKGRLVRALLLKGHGSNGKDTLRECVAAMYGYRGMTGATLTDFAAYDEGRKFPLSRLNRSRINWASENANTAKLDKIQSLKAFITGDTLDIEGKGKDHYEFTPVGVALFNVNDTPNLQASLEAIQSRYGVLTFNKTFKIGADLSKGELEADPRFKYDPSFLATEVLPAFLNRVLDALVKLMAEDIDYKCTQQALEDIQAENSHLFQFCQENGLGYDPSGTVSAGEIWERLEAWYLDNGTLTYEETSNGKKKSLWVDQARRGDANVKGANQVIARFQNLFPNAKRVTVGKGKMALRGISFGSTDPNGEAVVPVGEAVVSQLVRQKPLPDKDGEPVTPVFLPCDSLRKNLDKLSDDERDQPLEALQPEKLTRLAHHSDTARDTALLTASPTASPVGSTASPAGSTASKNLKGQRVRVHCSGAQRDGKTGIVQSVDGETVTVWLDDSTLPQYLRSWDCHFSFLEVLHSQT